MAVYAATVTLDTPRPGRLGNTPMGVLSGICNLTNYNSTLAEITTITKAFLTGGVLRVVPTSLTSNGYVVQWDTTGKAFKAYRSGAASGSLATSSGNPATHPLGVTASSGTIVSDTIYTAVSGVTVAAAALAEVANDVNIGTFAFIVVGQMGGG